VAVRAFDLSVRTKLPPEPLSAILAELVSEGRVSELEAKLYIHGDRLTDVQQQLLRLVGGFHHDKPESPGITAAQLFETARLPKDVFDGLIKLLMSQGKLVERKHRLALPEHREAFSEVEVELLRDIESLFKNRLFNPPKREEIVQSTRTAPERVDKVLRILLEQERLVRVECDLLFHAEAVGRAREILTSFIKKEGKLESVKFKYLLDTTRKFAIPLLDYFDRIRVTRSVGRTRYLAKQ
jgi:selenocysteine-specific elongation factor